MSVGRDMLLWIKTKAPNWISATACKTKWIIVKPCDGNGSNYSEVGHGTDIHVYLPRVLTEEVVPNSERASSLAGGSEAVLLVEDEEALSEMTAEMLAKRSETSATILRSY